MAGVLRGLQNRCRPVSQAEVGSIPTLSAKPMDEDFGKTRGQDGNASPSIADLGNVSKINCSAFMPRRIFNESLALVSIVEEFA